MADESNVFMICDCCGKSIINVVDDNIIGLLDPLSYLRYRCLGCWISTYKNGKEKWIELHPRDKEFDKEDWKNINDFFKRLKKEMPKMFPELKLLLKK